MSRDTTDYRIFPDAQLEHRINFFDGMFLSVQDFIDQQRHRVDRLRRALAHLSVSGIVDGLTLSSPAPGIIEISPGTAIDRHGRQLVVATTVEDVAIPDEWVGRAVAISVYYDETEERVMGGSANEQGARGATRIRETVRVEFHPQGSQPTSDAVVLGTVSVADDKTCTLIKDDPERVFSGLHFPCETGQMHMRAQGPVAPQLLALDGSLTVSRLGRGRASPEVELDAAETTRLDSLHIRSHTFKVAGNSNAYYPVVFANHGGSSGLFDLEVVRANSSVDGNGSGSLMLRCHGTVGANEPAALAVEVHQNKRFVADAQVQAGQPGFVVLWLMGGRTYAWRSGHHMALHGVGQGNGIQVGQSHFAVRSEVAERFRYDGVRHAPKWYQLSARDKLTADSQLLYSAVLNRLDVAEQVSATVRAQTLQLGHSTQLGKLGQALHDGKSTLIVNHQGWSRLELGGTYTHIKTRLSVDASTLQVARAKRSLASLVAEQSHLGLVRGSSNTGGRKLFLSLIQNDQNPPKVAEVRTVLRFQHQHRYSYQIEGSSAGLHFLTGNAKNGAPTATGALAVSGNLSTTKNLSATQVAGATATLKGTTAASVAVTGTLRAQRLIHAHPARLVRARSETAGGAVAFVDIRQDDSNRRRVPEVRANIRFHHGHRFWHALEASQAGFSLRTGTLSENDFSPAHTGSIELHGSLSTTDMSAAVLRCYDFKLGHKDRRGSAGRALVDDTDKLRLNYVTDWDQTHLGGKVYSSKQTYIGGKAAVAGNHETGLRLLRGTVKADGTIESGSGFTISKEGNKWKVSFSPAFSVLPTVVTVQQYPDENTSKDGGDTRDNAIVVAVNKQWAYIKTGKSDGDHRWRRFHFLAAGR